MDKKERIKKAKEMRRWWGDLADNVENDVTVKAEVGMDLYLPSQDFMFWSYTGKIAGIYNEILDTEDCGILNTSRRDYYDETARRIVVA